MIQVLLLILKIIGIVLLSLLLLVLFVLVLVLFAPIRYRVRAVHNPEKTEVSGRASFLFPLIVFKFRYFEKVFSYKGRAAWYVFLESGKNKDKNEAEESKKGKPAESVQKPEKADGIVPLQSVTEDAGDAEDNETKEILEKITPLSAPEDSQKNTAEKKKTKKEKPKKEKKEKTGEKTGFLEKIKRLWRQKDEVVRILSKPESKASIALGWDGVIKTLRHILPGKVKGYLLFGSGDPASTGQILGVICVLYAAMGPVFKVTPDFQEKRLECDLEFRGRLRVFTLLVILLKLYFNKELKQLIQELKEVKEIE